MARWEEPTEVVLERILKLPKQEAAGVLEHEVKVRVDETLRSRIVSRAIWIFCIMSVSTFLLVAVTSIVETCRVLSGSLNPDARLVDSKVLIALVTATVAQVSAILIIMIRWMFPNGTASPPRDPGQTA